MTVLLDAYALIAYFRDEPAAAEVQQMLWSERLAMSAVQLAEVVDRMERVYGFDADHVEVAVSSLGIEILAADYAVGAQAGRVRAAHYGPTGRTLSLADSVCAATASLSNLTVATADPILLQVCSAIGCGARQLASTGPA